MIATVAFSTKGPVLEGMLVSDVQATAMCKGVREVFAGVRTQFKDMEFVSGVGHGLEERAKEVQWLWGVQC